MYLSICNEALLVICPLLFFVCLQTSCIVRVPFEIIKQRAQANRELKPFQILRHTLQTEVYSSP